jgi:hypothetical protein
MIKPRTIAVGGLLLVLAIPLPIFAQGDKPKSADDFAKSYSQQMQGLQEQAEALRKQFVSAKPGSPEIEKIYDRMSAVSKQMDRLWDSTEAAQKAAFRKKRDEIVSFNDANKRLEYSTAILGSQDNLLENVRQNPNQGDFEKKKDQMSQEWERKYGSRLKPFGDEFDERKEELFKQVKDAYGIDLKTQGYARIGTSNPYENNAYYRYYDKDGKLRLGVWTDAAKSLEKWQKDNEASNRRQRDQKEQLDKQRTELLGFQRDFKASRDSIRSSVQEQIAAVQKARKGAGDLAGTTWVSRSSDGQSDRWSFQTGGNLAFQNLKIASDNGTGSWSVSGDTISLRTGAATWSGKIVGDRMEGTASNRSIAKTWTWTAQRQ